MKKYSYRKQRTIARPVEVQGIGFITGKNVRVRFRPAPAATGVVFVRLDLGPHACIGAHVDNVTGTRRRTTLGDGMLQVGLAEHVLAALGGLRIDNCYIELDAPELPGLDGSSQGFVDSLLQAGIVTQTETRTIWGVEQSIILRQQDATLALHPPTHQELRASYLLDYGSLAPIHRQIYTQEITPETFLGEFACCRTFLLEQEALEQRRQGLGSRTQVSDLLVFGPKGPIDNRLRFANEPARHKVLDILGDLSLLGHDLCGHIVAYRSGHQLNIDLVRTLSRQLNQVVSRKKLAA